MRTGVMIAVVAGMAVAAGCVCIMLIHREADSLQYRYTYDDQGRVRETIDPGGTTPQFVTRWKGRGCTGS
jgi:YD repeat-containing protein